MMRTKPIRNVPASIHARLLNLARARDTQLNFLLQSYAAERFLYRLDRSQASDRFTLKGATLFVVWGGETFRGTRDVDLLRSGFPEQEELRDDLASIGTVPCPEDGVVFELGADDLRLRALPVGRTQGAVRARLNARTGQDPAATAGRCRLRRPPLPGSREVLVSGSARPAGTIDLDLSSREPRRRKVPCDGTARPEQYAHERPLGHRGARGPLFLPRPHPAGGGPAYLWDPWNDPGG